MQATSSVTFTDFSVDGELLQSSIFAQTLQQAGVGLALISLQGQFLYVNQAGSRLLGQTQEQLLGRPWQNFVLSAEPRISDAQSTEQKRWLLRVNQSLWLMLNMTLIKDAITGAPSHFFAILCDATAQKIAEQELLAARSDAENSRAQAALALGAANIGIWEYLPNQKRIICEEHCRRLFGLDDASDEIDFAGLQEVIHPDDFPRLKNFLRKLLKSTSRSAQAIEFRAQPALGGRVFAATGRFLPGTDEKPGRALGTVIDVTEAKLTEQKIFESEERFRTLVETIPQIVWTCEGDGRPVYFNQRWHDYSGYKGDVDRMSFAMNLIHPEDREHVEAKWCSSVRTGQPFTQELRLRSYQGEYRWFICRALPLVDGRDQVSYWFGTATDINEQKKMAEEMKLAKEKAERAGEMKASFLANMSHEIRTPLGAILGFTDLLHEDVLSECEKKEFLQVIARNGRVLSRIVDDILDLSKVEAGLLKIDRIAVNPVVLVNDVVSLFAERARSKNLWLDLRVATRLPESLWADPNRIRQVVNNLISNAVKFTERGGVMVEVAIQNKMFVVSVRDTGIGIAPEQIKRLFQPFTQADESMTRRFGGTGLGLHLSRRLAEAMGGQLEIDCSEPDHGSCFSLRIPWELAPESTQSELVNQPSETPVLGDYSEIDPSLYGARILVVEDSEDNRLLIERLLRKKGIQVDFAENGDLGISKALNRAYDLILMDLQMPDVDGFEATETLRKMGISTPIIALTAHVIEEIQDKCKKVGCDGFLAKPIHAPELLKVLRERILH